MKPILSFFAVIASFGLVVAGTNGGAAGAFSRLGAGARAKALGNAYTGLAQGPSAIYFNPGALPFGAKRELVATVSRMALDRRLDYVAFSTPVRPKAGPEKKTVTAGIGLGWLHGGVDEIDSRDFDGNPLETMSQSSNLFLFSFGLLFHERFGAGLTTKVVYETFGKIGNDHSSVNGDGFGADAAVFARPVDHFSVGAQLRNVGAKTTWNTTNYWSQGSSKADQWPLDYRFGAAYERFGLVGAVDLETSAKQETRLHAGLEGALELTERQSLAGRVGYDDGAFSFGMGLGFTFWKVNSFLDVTYTFENVAPNDAQTAAWGVRF